MHASQTEHVMSPFLREYLVWTWLTTPRQNRANLVQPSGKPDESAASKYIDKHSTLFPFGKISTRLFRVKIKNIKRTYIEISTLCWIELECLSTIPFIPPNFKYIWIEPFRSQLRKPVNSPCEPEGRTCIFNYATSCHPACDIRTNRP